MTAPRNALSLPALPLLGACLMLSACFPVTLWHQPGVTQQRLQTDQAACAALALRIAPVDRRTEIEPPVWIPAGERCEASAGPGGQIIERCESYGGYWERGEIITYDANESRRRAETARCMTGRGYARVELPRCDRTAASTQVSGRMTPITAESCAAPAAGGGWVVLR